MLTGVTGAIFSKLLEGCGIIDICLDFVSGKFAKLNYIAAMMKGITLKDMQLYVYQNQIYVLQISFGND